MELFKTFGIEPTLLVAQIVNFLIILYLLKRFLYKPVLEMLKQREKTIREGLEKAEQARLLLERTQDEEKTILQKAQQQATRLVEEAKDHAVELMKQSEERSKQHTEKMITEAKDQIMKETRDAEKRLARNVSELAVAFLRKSLSDILSEREQKEIMTRAIQKLKVKPS